MELSAASSVCLRFIRLMLVIAELGEVEPVRKVDGTSGDNVAGSGTPNGVTGFNPGVL